jgi:TrmH family RNA methyltransferase
VWLADAGGELTYDAVEWTRPVALIVGGEADGPGAEARSLAQATIGIPMKADTESLNTAAATAVILFEAARQRRLGGLAT